MSHKLTATQKSATRIVTRNNFILNSAFRYQNKNWLLSTVLPIYIGLRCVFTMALLLFFFFHTFFITSDKSIDLLFAIYFLWVNHHWILIELVNSQLRQHDFSFFSPHCLINTHFFKNKNVDQVLHGFSALLPVSDYFGIYNTTARNQFSIITSTLLYW